MTHKYMNHIIIRHRNMWCEGPRGRATDDHRGKGEGGGLLMTTGGKGRGGGGGGY